MSSKQAETSKSIFRNVLYGFSTWILPLFLSFIAIRVIIRALGEEEFGIYMLVLGFVGYSFNFNMGRAVTKYIAEYQITGQRERIRDIISTTFFLNVFIGLLNVAVICFTARWLITDVFKIGEQNQHKTLTAFYIAAAIIFFTMLNQVFNAVLQGIQRFDVYSKIFNISSVVLISGNIFLAIYGFGLNELLLWNLIVMILNNIVFFISAKSLLPEFGISCKFETETLKLVSRFSFGIIGYQILANFLLLFERSWMTRKLGVESLTYYVVPMTLALYIHSFVGSLLLVIFPLASELKNDPVRLVRLYSKATKTICLLVVFMAATLIVQSRFFLTVWLGAEFAERSTTILILHTITFSFLAIQIVSWQMTDGLGHPTYNFKIFFITLFITIFLMLTLTKNYGSVGVAIARTAGFATLFLSIFYVEKWFFKKIQTVMWVKIAGILSVSALLSVFIQKVIILYLPFSQRTFAFGWINFSLNWITLLISVFSGGIVYLLAIWSLGFVAEDEKLLLRHILKRN